MDAGDTKGEVAVAYIGEPGCPDHFRHFILCREFTDGFDQIGVGVGVARHHRAEPGYDDSGPGIIERA